MASENGTTNILDCNIQGRIVIVGGQPDHLDQDSLEQLIDDPRHL